MKKIFSHTEKGTGKNNEDSVGSFDNVAWVIDGATPVFDKNLFPLDNDVVWIVEQLTNTIPHFINNNSSLEEILLNSIEQVRKQAYEFNSNLDNVKPYELPTFTIVLIRMIGEELEYYILGDAGMLIDIEGDIQYLTDKRLEKFTRKNQKAIEEALSSKNSKNNSNELVTESLKETRKLLNKEEGYWIGSIDGKGIPHGIKGKCTFKHNERVLCFSDGYSRIFELYKSINIEDVRFEPEYITETIEEIRNIERKDSNCSLYPRAKPSDDLSVILIENNQINNK